MATKGLGQIIPDIRNRRVANVSPGILLVGICCIWHATLARAASIADEGLSFNAPFDGTARAAVCDGGSAEPNTAHGCSFVPGVLGQAVYVGQHGKGPYDQMPLLEYDGAKHFPTPTMS